MIWLKTQLWELRLSEDGPMPMYCDNQASIYIASNPVFHERTKYIEINCHFDRNVVTQKLISTPFTPLLKSSHMFTKLVILEVFLYLCNKLDIIDIYAPT